MKISFKIQTVLLFALSVFLFVTTVSAQKRDNLTEKEDAIIREAQELDLRMKVMVKIIDRRLLALNGATTEIQTQNKKSKEKDDSDWGELRTGTFGELFWDIQKSLDEAIMKIDDAAEHDMNNPLFGKAVHILADGCQKWTPQFKTFLDKTKDEKEQGLVLGSIEFCNQIIEASAKVPKDVPKKKN